MLTWIHEGGQQSREGYKGDVMVAYDDRGEVPEVPLMVKLVEHTYNLSTATSGICEKGGRGPFTGPRQKGRCLDCYWAYV